MVGFSLKTESYRKGVVLSTGLSLVAKGIQFLITPCIAFLFGAGESTDILFFCMSTVTIAVVLLTSINNAIVIPRSMHLDVKEGADCSMRYLNTILLGYLVLGAALAFLVAFNPVWTLLRVSHFTPEAAINNASVVAAFGFVVPLMSLSITLSDVLFSKRYFTIPMLLSGGTSLISLTFLALFHESVGILSLPLALLLAYSVSIFLLGRLMQKSLQWCFTRIASTLQKDYLNLLWAYLGNSMSSAASFLPVFLLSGSPQGTLTAFNYAQTAANIPLTLIITQYSSVVGIRLNAVHSRDDWPGLNRILLSSGRALIWILVPIATLLSLFSTEVIRILFQHGTVSREVLQLASSALAVLAWVCVPAGINTIGARLNMAQQKVRQAVLYQTAFNVALMSTIWLALKAGGPMGYPCALVLVNFLNVVVLIWYFKKTAPLLLYAELPKFLLLTLTVNLPFAAALLLTKSRWEYFSNIAGVAALALTYVFGLAILNSFWRLEPETAKVARNVWLKLGARFHGRAVS